MRKLETKTSKITHCRLPVIWWLQSLSGWPWFARSGWGSKGASWISLRFLSEGCATGGRGCSQMTHLLPEKLVMPGDKEAGLTGWRDVFTQRALRKGTLLKALLASRSALPSLSSLWTSAQLILKKYNLDPVPTLMKTQMSPCHWLHGYNPSVVLLLPPGMKPKFLGLPCKALVAWPRGSPASSCHIPLLPGLPVGKVPGYPFFSPLRWTPHPTWHLPSLLLTLPLIFKLTY